LLVEMIAAPIVAFGEIDQLPAQCRATVRRASSSPAILLARHVSLF
jgi:hypothetical protein